MIPQDHVVTVVSEELCLLAVASEDHAVVDRGLVVDRDIAVAILSEISVSLGGLIMQRSWLALQAAFEPLRVPRRPFRLSHATSFCSSSMA